jgi:putative restriction endonuclease
LQEALQKYVILFKKLRIDRTHGVAPHKPVLLLSVLQAYQNGLITGQRIYITPELVGLFKATWNLLVMSKHDCRISYPFYYLKSAKFWKLIPRSGFVNIENMSSVMKSFTNLNTAIEFAEINRELYYLMMNTDTNIFLQQFLLDEYFPQTKGSFKNSAAEQQKIFDDIEGKILNEDAAEYRAETRKIMEQQNEEEIFLRGSLFKREIPKIYNNTCCISGMKIDSTITVSMIDACHVIPFSKSYDDTISNGIALCPNLHRAFDRGLIGIDNEYKVIVSGNFKEDETNYSIKAFEGKSIRLPKQRQYYPSPENIEWHRKEILK